MAALAKISIIKANQEWHCLAYDQSDKLVYHIEDNEFPLLDAVYKAKITAVNYKTYFAYIEYLPGSEGVINLKGKKVQAGRYILCQNTWLGDTDKLPKFSSEIKLVGKYVILLPGSTEHFFSSRLKVDVSEIADKYKGIGLIFRHAIDDVSSQVVIGEIESLLSQLAGLKDWEGKPWGRIIPPSYKFFQLLRDAKLAENVEIYTNDDALFEQLTPYVELWQLGGISLDSSLTYDPNLLQEHLKKGLEFGLEIHKLSGINLIDVNSKNAKLNFYQINSLVIDEIVRQIWLRDMTGIILIDFIKNMTSDEANKLKDKLKQFLSEDWRRTQVLGFTKAGICEIIRNK